MPATNVLELELIDLLFLNAAFDNVGDVTGLVGSSTPGSFEVSLHTATLPDTATQTTSELTYTGYGRVDVARSGTAWTNTAGTVTNDAAITFGADTVGSETATDFGLGSDVVADELWIYGALGSSLAISPGITPEFAAGDLDVSIT